jgi:hypothetical protein
MDMVDAMADFLAFGFGETVMLELQYIANLCEMVPIETFNA